jgi:hypothetical protein
MITKILHFLQVLEILGKWLSKAAKNYHITAGFIFITRIATISPNRRFASFYIDLILVSIMIFGYLQKDTNSKSKKSGFSINISNKNININKNKPEKQKKT